MTRQVTGYQNAEGLSNYLTATLHLRPGESAEVEFSLHPALALATNEPTPIAVTPSSMTEVACG